MGKRFLLADDHSIVRDGLKALLEKTYPGSFVDELIDGTKVLERLKKNVYDLIILDVQMPDTDTPALVKLISSEYPSLPVLVYSMASEQIYALRVMKAGAKGFLTKDAPLEELKKAVELLLNQKKYISQAIVQLLANQSLFDQNDNPFSKLSPREFQITTLLLQGKSISEIANELKVEVSTASTHKARLLNKLGVKNLLGLKELATFHKI